MNPRTWYANWKRRRLYGACLDTSPQVISLRFHSVGRPDEVAAGVVSTVIHVSGDRFVLDAGAKSLSKDRAEWLESYGHIVGTDAVIDRLNDNHGMVEGEGPVEVGDRVTIVPNHICPVVDLFDEVVLVGDEVRQLNVDLRGKVQ